MLNSVLGFAGVSAEGEQDATSRAQAISAILPALRIPLSMIRLLSHLQHCRNARRCPSQIITVDIVCNIHMMTASRVRSRFDRQAAASGRACIEGSRQTPPARPFPKVPD